MRKQGTIQERRLIKAKGIASRCNEAGVKPPVWVKILLDPLRRKPCVTPS